MRLVSAGPAPGCGRLSASQVLNVRLVSAGPASGPGCGRLSAGPAPPSAAGFRQPGLRVRRFLRAQSSACGRFPAAVHSVRPVPPAVLSVRLVSGGGPSLRLVFAGRVLSVSVPGLRSNLAGASFSARDRFVPAASFGARSRPLVGGRFRPVALSVALDLSGSLVVVVSRMAQPVGFGPFSFDVPDHWTLSSVILSGPVEAPDQGAPPFQRNLITAMEAVSADETAESFVQKYVAALASADVTQQVPTPEEVSLADGELRGLITEHVVTGPHGEKVRQMQLVFIKEGIAFTAIASHLDGPPFENAREEFRSMLLSYR